MLTVVLITYRLITIAHGRLFTAVLSGYYRLSCDHFSSSELRNDIRRPEAMSITLANRCQIDLEEVFSRQRS